MSHSLRRALSNGQVHRWLAEVDRWRQPLIRWRQLLIRWHRRYAPISTAPRSVALSIYPDIDDATVDGVDTAMDGLEAIVDGVQAIADEIHAILGWDPRHRQWRDRYSPISITRLGASISISLDIERAAETSIRQA